MKKFFYLSSLFGDSSTIAKLCEIFLLKKDGKIIRNILFLVCFCAVFVFQTSSLFATDYITFNPTNLNFSKLGGSQTFSFATNTPNQTITCTVDWLSATRTSNNSVTVTCLSNQGCPRGGAVTINCGTTGGGVSIGQDGSFPTANAGSALSAIYQGGTTAQLGGSVGGSATGGTWSTTAGGTFSPSASTLNATWTPPSGYSGTATLTLTASGGCGTATSSKTQVVNPTTVGTPVFSLGATSTRSQGSGSVTYTATATNSTGITYSLDAASIAGGNSINSSTGGVTYDVSWSGNTIITASAAGPNGPKTATHTATVTAINYNVCATDLVALRALWLSTNGPGWTNKTGWFTNTDVESWYGITLSGGCVIGIWIRDNNLTGTLPAQLGNLSSLISLCVDHNLITGPIPPELGYLSSLECLWLYNNNFEGSIPASLGNLTNLDFLAIGSNNLTGYIPASLGNLTNLTNLNLSNCNLTGTIPPQLGNLTNLEWLMLDNNSLDGTIPTSIGNLSNLQYLFLNNNNITGSIPTSLGNLTNLGDLSLGSNNLTGYIPASLGNLTNLKSLSVDNNSITGSIPSELGNLTNLEWLMLDNNSLDGTIPTSIGNLSNLQYLFLNNNNITGNIPYQMGNLFNLQFLWLLQNNLTGIVPEWVCNISNAVIKGGNNSYSTPYPSCWSTLKSATVTKVFDPSEVMTDCMNEAISKNISAEEISNYVHECISGKLKANQTTANQEVSFVNQLKAFPNPASELLNIESPFENYNASIFDYTGRRVFEQNCCGNESINVSRLTQGIYLLVVESEGNQETLKITIK